MPQVQTVLGPVDVSGLGRTFTHEHVFVLTADVRQNYPEEWDDDARVADAVRIGPMLVRTPARILGG